MGLLEADDLKHRGDLAYKASCFTQAIRHYTAAIGVGGDSQSIYSNRSASKFESGDYEGSLADAATAFKLDASSDLAPKLALRAFKASYWACDMTSATEWLDKASVRSTCDVTAVLQSHLESAEELSRYSAGTLLPQLLTNRAGFVSGEEWRASCGDSTPRSLLSGFSNNEDGYTSVEGQVPLASSNRAVQRAEPAQHNVAVLIKDCGDLGHLWCTLVDAAERCQQPEALRLHVRLHSNRAEDLCRVVLLLDALCTPKATLPTHNANGADSVPGHSAPLSPDSEPASASQPTSLMNEESTAFFWHLSASNFLCPVFASRCRALLRRVAAAERLTDVLPFARMHAHQWPEVRRVSRVWAEAAVSVADARAQVRVLRRRDTLATAPPKALAGLEPFLEGLDAVADGRPDAEIASEMRTKLSATAADCTPQAIKAFRSELKAFIRSQWTNVAGLRRYAILRALPGTHRGDHGYADTFLRLPLPPRLHAAFADCSGSGGAAAAAAAPAATAAAPQPVPQPLPLEKYAELAAARADPGQLVGLGAVDGGAGDEVFEGLSGAEAGWQPNPTMTHVTAAAGDAPKVTVAEVGGLGGLAALMQCPLFSGTSADRDTGRRAHEYAAAVYGRVAAALRTLTAAGALNIEIVHGHRCSDPPGIDRDDDTPAAEPDACGPGSGAGGGSGEGLRFDRVHLAAVPEDTGLLAALVDTLPQLKREPHALLTHSVACDTATGEDYEALVQGHTCAPCVEAAGDILGARFCGGGAWDADACWAPLDNPPDISTVTCSRLKLWLHKLIHSLVFPSSQSSVTQPARPPTLQILLPLLKHLSGRFPPHWLHRALEPLLQPPSSRSLPLQLASQPASRTPSRSPSRPPSVASATTLVPLHLLDAAEAWGAFEKHVEASDAAPARAELCALAALWLRSLPRPLAAVLAASPIGDGGRVCVYEVRLPGSASHVEARSSSHTACCGGHTDSQASGLVRGCRGSGLPSAALGLVVYAPRLGQQRGGQRGILRDVRRALRTGRAAVTEGILLVSVATLQCQDDGAVTARWPMVPQDFEERAGAGHLCAVFAIDTWTTDGGPHVRLSTATPVATLWRRPPRSADT
eukprot:jgi/Ulvmu1/1647/UM114_0015.1